MTSDLLALVFFSSPSVMERSVCICATRGSERENEADAGIGRDGSLQSTRTVDQCSAIGSVHQVVLERVLALDGRNGRVIDGLGGGLVLLIVGHCEE